MFNVCSARVVPYSLADPQWPMSNSCRNKTLVKKSMEGGGGNFNYRSLIGYFQFSRMLCYSFQGNDLDKI